MVCWVETHRTESDKEVVLLASFGLLDNLYGRYLVLVACGEQREKSGTIGEIDEIELLGRVRVLESLEP
jgi:hypothetical protein